MPLRVLDSIESLVGGLFALSLVLLSPYYSFQFVTTLYNLNLSIDPFLVRVFLAFILSATFILIYKESAKKHYKEITMFAFFLFLTSPLIVENLLTLKDLLFLFMIPLVSLSYFYLRYGKLFLGLLIVVILTILDPRSLAAFSPAFFMFYFKYKNPLSLVLAFFSLAAYYLFNPLPLTVHSYVSFGFIFAIASASLLFFKEDPRAFVGFLSMLPFASSPYAVFPLFIVSIDVLHDLVKMREKDYMALLFLSFFGILYMSLKVGLSLPQSGVVAAAFSTLFLLFEGLYKKHYQMLFALLLFFLLIDLGFVVDSMAEGKMVLKAISYGELISIPNGGNYVHISQIYSLSPSSVYFLGPDGEYRNAFGEKLPIGAKGVKFLDGRIMVTGGFLEGKSYTTTREGVVVYDS